MNSESLQEEHTRLARKWSLGTATAEERERCRALKHQLINLRLTARALEKREPQRFTGASITDFGTFTS